MSLLRPPGGAVDDGRGTPLGRRRRQRDLVAELVLAWIDALAPVVAARRPPRRWSRARRDERRARIALEDTLATVPDLPAPLPRPRRFSPPASRCRSPPARGSWPGLPRTPAGTWIPSTRCGRRSASRRPPGSRPGSRPEQWTSAGSGCRPARWYWSARCSSAACRSWCPETPRGCPASIPTGGATAATAPVRGCRSVPDRTPARAAPRDGRAHAPRRVGRPARHLTRGPGAHRPEPGPGPDTVPLHPRRERGVVP